MSIIGKKTVKKRLQIHYSALCIKIIYRQSGKIEEEEEPSKYPAGLALNIFAQKKWPQPYLLGPVSLLLLVIGGLFSFSLSLPQFCVLLVLSLARKKEMFCFCFETDPFGFNAERKCSLNFQVVYKEMSEKFEFFEFLVCECFFPLKIKKVLPQKQHF